MTVTRRFWMPERPVIDGGPGATEALVGHARRLGKDTLHTAVALELVTGLPWTSLCCWCLEKHDPHGERPAYRINGGDCVRCHYTGRDTLVVTT